MITVKRKTNKEVGKKKKGEVGETRDKRRRVEEGVRKKKGGGELEGERE